MSANHGGDIVFDIYGNDTGYRYTIDKIEKDAKKSGSKITKSLDGAFKSSEKAVAQSSNKIAKSFNKIKNSGVKSANNLSSAFSSFGKKLIALIGVYKLVGAMKNLIKSSIEYGDEVDKNSQKMGMSAKAYQQWDYILDRCGASMDSMKPAMKTLAKAAYSNNEAFTKLGITQEELRSLNQEQLFARTIEQLQKVGNTTERTALAAQLLGRGATELGAVLNLSSQEMNEMIARTEYLGGTFSGTAVANCAAFKDIITDLKLAFRGLGAVLAEYVLPVITTVINGVIIPAIVRLRAALDSFLSRIPLFRKIRETFNKNTTKDIGNVASGMGDVAAGAGNLGNNSKKAKKDVQALKRELMGFDKITKLSGDKGTSSDSGTSGAGGVGSVGGLDLSEAEGSVSRFTFSVNDLLSKIKLPESLQNAISRLGDAFERLFGIIGQAGKWAWDNILVPLGKWTMEELAPRVVNLLAVAFEELCDALEVLAPLWNTLYDNFIKPFAQIFGVGLLTVIDGITIAVKIFGEGLETTLKGVHAAVLIFLEGWETVKKIVVWIADFIGNVFISAWNGLKKVIDTVVNSFKALYQWIVDIPQKWQEFKQKVTDWVLSIKLPKWEDILFRLNSWKEAIKNKIKEFAGTIGINMPTWDSIKTKLANWKDAIKNAIKGMAGTIGINFPSWDGIKKRLNSWKDSIKKIIGNIGGTFKLDFTANVQNLKNWLNNNIIDKINNKFSNVPILNRVKIPRLAQGGYVKANTPQLAMIGDNKFQGEVVAPEDKLQQMANQAAGAGNSEILLALNAILRAIQSQDTNVYLDGEEIKNNVVRRINNHTISTGQLELLI